MKTTLQHSVVALVSLLATAPLIAAPQIVSVRVLDTRGTAIAGIGLEFIPTPPDQPLGGAVTVKASTDEQGVASAVVDVPAGQERIWTRIVPAPTEGTPMQRAESPEWKAFYDVRNRFYLSPVFEVPVSGAGPGVIRLQDAVTVSGRVIDADGKPWTQGVAGGLEVSIAAVQLALQRLDDNGRFTVHGVPKGQDFELYVASGHSYMRVKLTARQTRDDVELGNIVMPRPQVSVPLIITCSGLDQIQQGYVYSVPHGGMLISADGKTLMGFVARKIDGVARLAGGSGDGAIWAPEGTYYVLPGLGVNGAHVRFVLDAIEGGERDALTDIPTVVAVDGAAARASVEINMLETYNLLREKAAENR